METSSTVATTYGKKHAMKITVIVMESLTIFRLAWISSTCEGCPEGSEQIFFVKYRPRMMLK